MHKMKSFPSEIKAVQASPRILIFNIHAEIGSKRIIQTDTTLKTPSGFQKAPVLQYLSNTFPKLPERFPCDIPESRCKICEKKKASSSERNVI